MLCFVRDVPSREYPLVIPDPSPSWPGLKAGARYKFLVSATHPTLGHSEASVVIETLSPPEKGKVVFSPASGHGVKTLFTVEAVDFHDDDVPLTYKFGYKNTKAKKIVWFKKVSSSLPSIETLLPASKNGLTLAVEVCDAFETCVTAESETSVRVNPADLTNDEILSLGEQAAKKAGDQECPEAMSLVTQIVESVKMNKNQVSSYLSPVCTLFSDILGQCVGQISNNLQCSDIETGQEVMEFFVNSPCESLDFGTIEASAALAGALSDKTKDCAAITSTEVATSALRKERVGYVIALEDIEDKSDDELSNGRKPSKLGFRRKRQTLANFVTDLVQTISSEDIEQYMNVAIKTIEAIEDTIEADESLDESVTDLKTKYKGYVTELLRDIHDNYMAEMCKGATALSAPDTVRAGDISVSMVKTELNKGADEKFVFDQTKRSLFDASSVQLMEGVYNKYSQWDCGKRSSDGSVLPCVGLCLGTAVLETDIVTPTSDLLDTEAATPPLVSKIHDIRLLNPATGADLTGNIQKEKLEEPMTLRINIENSTKRTGMEFKV